MSAPNYVATSIAPAVIVPGLFASALENIETHERVWVNPNKNSMLSVMGGGGGVGRILSQRLGKGTKW